MMEFDSSVLNQLIYLHTLAPYYWLLGKAPWSQRPRAVLHRHSMESCEAIQCCNIVVNIVCCPVSESIRKTVQLFLTMILQNWLFVTTNQRKPCDGGVSSKPITPSAMECGPVNRSADNTAAVCVTKKFVGVWGGSRNVSSNGLAFVAASQRAGGASRVASH